MSKAMGITTNLSGSSLISDRSQVWIEDIGKRIDEKNIVASPRVGVDYAEECATWNWRFRIADSKWTSKAK